LSGPPKSSGGSLGQSNALFGLGQNEQLLRTVSIEPQSSVADPLAGIPIQIPDIDISSPPYASYQSGQLVALGVLRGLYICKYLGYLCEQRFSNPDSLQDHFENSHFPITRIKPAHRYICSRCEYMNDCHTGPCQNCRIDGSIEIWIYGHFISNPSHQRYPPDGQDPFRGAMPSSRLLYPEPYAFPGPNLDFGQGPRNGGSFTGDFNDDFGFNGDFNGDFNGGFDGSFNGGFGFMDGPNNAFGGDNTFGDDGSQGYYHNNTHDTPQSGGYQSQGNRSLGARYMAKMGCLSIRSWYTKALQNHRYRFSLLALALLVTIALIIETHDWLIMTVRVFPFRPNLATMGLIVGLASFATGYAYWSLKRPSVQHVVSSVSTVLSLFSNLPLDELTVPANSAMSFA